MTLCYTFSIDDKRRLNEKKFPNWEGLSNGGRRYWLEVSGRHGWKARYIKEVDDREETVKFYQEIYNGKGNLIEIHEKFPMDKGHKRLKEK
ncbi:MAG: hypothetical protein QMC83_09460 [Thermodesulfovibrionales bacterium]|nr:hypothetical protein [Thermodesulfovibrionales bacterium]